MWQPKPKPDLFKQGRSKPCIYMNEETSAMLSYLQGRLNMNKSKLISALIQQEYHLQKENGQDGESK